MKKSRLLFIAAAILFAACSSDEGATDEWNGEIRLTSGLDVQSRATTDWTNKVFDSGREIDVQISEKTTGTATTTYAPLVYTTGDNGSLKLTQGNQPYYPASGNGVNIYAVYPKGSDETFTVATDQSDDADYKASDLMYASVSTERTSNAVNLEFKHLLSKVTIELTQGNGTPNLAGATVELLNVLPTTKFTASSGEIGENAQGTATPIKVFTATSTSLSGSCIVPPQTLGVNFVQVTLSDGGVLIGKLNSGTPKLLAGNEYKYEIKVNLTELSIKASITPWGTGGSDSGTAKMYIGNKFASQAAVGDYYLSDGSLVDKDATLTDVQKNACIGIVFALESDANGYDESKYPDGMTLHGYVVALNDANSGNACAWSSSYESTSIGNVSSFLAGEDNYTDDISKKYEWSGYTYTQEIAGQDDYSLGIYPAAYYAENYTPKAPSGTSGWFLPAAGQLIVAMNAINNSDGGIATSYSNAGGTDLSTYYWSSSEWSSQYYQEDYALVFCNGFGLTHFNKGYTVINVRPVLAF